MAVTWGCIQINVAFCDSTVNQHAWCLGRTREGVVHLCLGAGQVQRWLLQKYMKMRTWVWKYLPSGQPIHGHMCSWFLFREPVRTRMRLYVYFLCFIFINSTPLIFLCLPLVLFEVMEVWPRCFQRASLPASSFSEKRIRTQRVQSSPESIIKVGIGKLSFALLLYRSSATFSTSDRTFSSSRCAKWGDERLGRRATSFQKQEKKPTPCNNFHDGLHVCVCVWFL